MNTEQFTKAYNESRNGCNHFVRHPYVSKFQYTDGVQDCAKAGCFWLVDIAATELPTAMRKKGEHMVVLTIKVKDDKGRLTATGSGDVKVWSKKLDFTDLPEGKWEFYISDEGERFAMILPSEY